MPLTLFGSRRERRLWLGVLAVVITIYSALGLAGTLANMLRDPVLAAAGFVLGMLLVGTTILTQGLRVRPRGVEIGVGLGVAAVCFMLLLRVTIPAERTHVIEYGVLGSLLHEALAERARHGHRVRFPALLAALTTASIGVLDEGLQWFLPPRVFDPRDILFNVLGGVTAVVASVVLGWVRRRRPEAHLDRKQPQAAACGHR